MTNLKAHRSRSKEILCKVDRRTRAVIHAQFYHESSNIKEMLKGTNMCDCPREEDFISKALCKIVVDLEISWTR